MTCDDVLVCDACGQRIAALERAMIFWQADRKGHVSSLRLAHKGDCDTPRLALSAELWWMATPHAALQRMAELAYDYRWTAEQLQRLAFIAWAVSINASPISRKRARAWHAERLEMGL